MIPSSAVINKGNNHYLAFDIKSLDIYKIICLRMGIMENVNFFQKKNDPTLHDLMYKVTYSNERAVMSLELSSPRKNSLPILLLPSEGSA